MISYYPHFDRTLLEVLLARGELAPAAALAEELRATLSLERRRARVPAERRAAYDGVSEHVRLHALALSVSTFALTAARRGHSFARGRRGRVE